MNRTAILALGLAFAVASASGASAQKPEQKPPAKPAPAKPTPAKTAAKPSDSQPLAFRGVVSVGLTSLASSQSFDAVAGTHSTMTFGFGGAGFAPFGFITNRQPPTTSSAFTLMSTGIPSG